MENLKRKKKRKGSNPSTTENQVLEFIFDRKSIDQIEKQDSNSSKELEFVYNGQSDGPDDRHDLSLTSDKESVFCMQPKDHIEKQDSNSSTEIEFIFNGQPDRSDNRDDPFPTSDKESVFCMQPKDHIEKQDSNSLTEIEFIFNGQPDRSDNRHDPFPTSDKESVFDMQSNDPFEQQDANSITDLAFTPFGQSDGPDDGHDPYPISDKEPVFCMQPNDQIEKQDSNSSSELELIFNQQSDGPDDRHNPYLISDKESVFFKQPNDHLIKETLQSSKTFKLAGPKQPVIDTSDMTDKLIPPTSVEKNVRIKVTHPKSNTKTIDENQSKGCPPLNVLKDILFEQIDFIKIYDIIHYWNGSLNIYIPLDGKKFDLLVRQDIPHKYKKCINSFVSREIFLWLQSDTSIDIPEEKLLRKKSFIAFKNGLFNIDDQTFYPHEKSIYFTSTINAHYPIVQNPTGHYFEKFLHQVTGGNNSIYKSIQELFGYIISEIREVKIIPFLLGPKDSGKSIILSILEHLIGEKYFTSLSFDDLNKDAYLYQLYGKKLNTCGETSEISLKRLDILKKLTGRDSIMAKPLYEQPMTFRNSAVLMFAGNHLPILKTKDSSNAFSERLLVFPFNNPVPKDKQDTMLTERLKSEINYIAKWSIDGIVRLKRNNFKFTSCAEVDDILNNYTIKNNTIEGFINTRCVIDPLLKIHSEKLETSYQNYCYEIGCVPDSSHEFRNYLTLNKNVIKKRLRIGEENKNGYVGITLKDGI